MLSASVTFGIYAVGEELLSFSGPIMSPHQLLLPEEAVYFTCVVLSRTPSDDSLAFTMQLTMLFVDELQFEAAFHESYNESGTMISLLDGVL